MRQVTLFLLLCGWFISAFSQTAKEQKLITEAKNKISTSVSDTAKILALLQLSKKFSTVAENKPAFLDSAALYTIQAEQLSESKHFDDGLAQSWLLHALILHAKND